MPVDIGRRDSARLAHALIRREGYPVAAGAAERISESPRAPPLPSCGQATAVCPLSLRGQLTWRRPEPRLVGRDLSWWNRKI